MHHSYVSYPLAALLLALFLSFYLVLNGFDFLMVFYPYPLSISYLVFICLVFILFIVSVWLYDLYYESYLYLVLNEQVALLLAVKLVILSEFMLFFSCFWAYADLRLITILPIVSNYSTYTFSIPFSNLLLLLFSSLPLQSANVNVKMGYLFEYISGLVRTIVIGLLFLCLQITEFLYALYSISDTALGSIYYFTTSLHGSHVLLGGMFLWLLLLHCLFYSVSIDIHLPVLFATYYWHFVDFIWLIVFVLLIL